MIRWAEDVGIPALVAAADYGTERLDEGKAPEETKYNPIVGLIMCVAGYGMTAFGMGGNYTKNLGIASMDWAVKGVRQLVAGAGITRAVGSSSRLSMRKKVSAAETGRYPTYRPEEEVKFSVT